MTLIAKPKEGLKEIIVGAVALLLAYVASLTVNESVLPHLLEAIEVITGTSVIGRVGAKGLLWGSQALALRGEAKAAAEIKAAEFAGKP